MTLGDTNGNKCIYTSYTYEWTLIYTHVKYIYTFIKTNRQTYKYFDFVILILIWFGFFCNLIFSSRVWVCVFIYFILLLACLPVNNEIGKSNHLLEYLLLFIFLLIFYALFIWPFSRRNTAIWIIWIIHQWLCCQID